MSEYRTTVGIEVHAELKTKTKKCFLIVPIITVLVPIRI